MRLRPSYSPNRHRVFSLEFAALNYVHAEKNQYAYKMEGFDEDWVYSGTRRFATYTNLPPGEYTIIVKGSNNDRIWNEEGASVRIIITPPWWRTNLAYAIYVVLFAAFLYGIQRFEVNRVKLRNELKMKEIEAQKLQEIDHMKSRLFANISHEFRTPLTLILGPVEEMLVGKFKGNFKENYEMILRNGRRLLRLINQLLDLSRLESGRMALETRRENIVSLLKGLVLSFASLAERKRITLKFNAQEESIEVYVDRDKLEKIVSNLLSNAFKFTPPGGEISVAVSTGQGTVHGAPKDFVEICVTDTSPGIPEEHLEKIFDRFYRADDFDTRMQEGSGIGLALTKELVELHHGEIHVDSQFG